MTTRAGSATAYHPWSTYIAAREEARRRGDRRVGTDHLVLGLLVDPEVAGLLGVTFAAARTALDVLDRDALAAIGISTDPVVPPLPTRALPAKPTVKAVTSDRLPLTAAAKLVLKEAGRPMRRERHINAKDVLRAVLARNPPDPGIALLDALGVDVPLVRRHLDAQPNAAG